MYLLLDEHCGIFEEMELWIRGRKHIHLGMPLDVDVAVW
jgi:hypothetical protein